MSTTKIYSDLFQNDGSGEQLRSEILPILPSVFYIDSVNGDDSNDGFSSSSPLKTIGKFIEIVSSPAVMKPATIIAHLLGGEYQESATGVPGITICYEGDSNARIKSIEAGQNGSIVLYGTLTTGYMAASRGGVIRWGDGLNLTFDFSLAPSSNPGSAIYVYIGGYLTKYSGANATITFTGSWNVSASVLTVQFGGIVVLYGGETWSGTVTGKRYSLTGGSICNGIGTTAIPGTVAGTVDSSSYFS